MSNKIMGATNTLGCERNLDLLQRVIVNKIIYYLHFVQKHTYHNRDQ